MAKENVRVVRLLPPEAAKLTEEERLVISQRAAAANDACGVEWLGDSPVIEVTAELKELLATAPVGHLLTVCPYRGLPEAIAAAARQAEVPEGVIVPEVFVFSQCSVRTG